MESRVRPGDTLLGKYQVERVLGQGGMGVVVAVRHLGLGELFAMKLLVPGALRVPELVERFLREARSAARLKGEHVTRVHDVGQLEDGSPYMVMEHLEGVDFKGLLKRKGPISPRDAVHYLAQAAEAVAEAHAAGIVHRDLKPANLFLIQRANGTPCVKVLDFGIAKLMHGVGDEAGLTATGVLLGSPLYMAPEQMVRSKKVDGRADIWALGVTLYELLTGVSPFKGKTMPEIVANVLQEDPPAPSTKIPAVPQELDALVARCLRKSASERFQTANELVEALRDMETSLGNPSNPTSLRGIERSSSQSLPFQATVGVAMVPALVLDNESSKSARRGGTLLGFLLGAFVVAVLGVCVVVWKTRGAEGVVEGVVLASSANTNGLVSASASASVQAEQAPVLPPGSQVVMGAKVAPVAASASPKAPLKKAAVQRRVVTDHLDEFR